MPRHQLTDAIGDLLTEFLAMPAGTPEFAWTGLRTNSINELRILHTILQCWFHNRSCSVSEISSSTSINKATVSRTVTDLMAQGFITEVGNADDGRRRSLVPTTQAKELTSQLEVWLNGWADRIAAIVERSDS